MGEVIYLREYHAKPKDHSPMINPKYNGLPPLLNHIVMVFHIAKQQDRATTWRILRSLEKDGHMDAGAVAIIKELVFDIVPNGDGGGRAA